MNYPNQFSSIKEKEIKIQTKRLELRPLKETDVSRITELLQDKRISDFAAKIPYPYTENHATIFINYTNNHLNELNFAIILETELIGIIGLIFEPENKMAEIGYWIGSPYWGNGYATEAAKALIDFAFNHLDVNKVHGKVYSHNNASARVLEKVGMVREGFRKKHALHGDEYFDLIEFGIFKQNSKQKNKQNLEQNLNQNLNQNSKQNLEQNLNEQKEQNLNEQNSNQKEQNLKQNSNEQKEEENSNQQNNENKI
ncbi:putative gnat family [Anaeramoeba ignava]|uniref:Gnat family n=1 Tax=Anaeramoeba ignava TaxID=1746090 RepID=A0A9Q0R553_ANAIG|nr:putative gnat family [Anaeramoeba ignava]